MRVLTLSNADIHAALSPAACEQAMAAVLAARARGDAFNPLRTVSAPPGAAGFIGLMPAYASVAAAASGPEAADAEGAAFGLKVVCIMRGNPARGLDAHQGTVTLYDGDTGMPTAILNASAITEIRTAAVTAVATRALARDGARVLCVLGAGVQARSHLVALARRAPVGGGPRLRAHDGPRRGAARRAARRPVRRLGAQEAVRGRGRGGRRHQRQAPGARARVARARRARQRRRRQLAHRLGDQPRDGGRRLRFSATAGSRCATRPASSGWPWRRG